MPRQARVVAEGVPHHITQRGNNRHVQIRDRHRVQIRDGADPGQAPNWLSFGGPAAQPNSRPESSR
jgi:hypothetical protein